MAEIKTGMIIKCLRCGKPIEIKENTIKKSWDYDFIYCPSCGKAFNVGDMEKIDG